MKKLSKNQIKKLKPYWKMARNLESIFYQQLSNIEEEMSKELKIKGLTFFHCDGMCGIGNEDRSIKLIDGFDLEQPDA